MNKYAKAIVAFLAPGAVMLIADSTNGITWDEVSVAVLTCIVTSAGVWAIPNAKIVDKVQDKV